MRKAFVDTNIFIDLLGDRKPFSKFAIEIFDQAFKNKLKLYTSTHIIATTHYLMKKYINEKELRKILLNLLEYVILVSVDTDVIKRSLTSKHKDFEEAIQILCTHQIENVECIVTRNLKDFKEAGIKVLAPDEFIKMINYGN